MEVRTLGLLKDTLVNTSFQCLVKQGVEHVVGGSDGVVGLDIFLQRLATTCESA